MYKSPRGTADILPQDQSYWTYVRQKAESISQLYGFQRIDTPVFEDARLFVRSIGEDTDIVQKEMYSFEDRSGDMLTLRPEGTAPVCRAYVQHGMFTLPQPVKLYYLASIFRYERPQAGRYREHHQFGVEALGEDDPALDSEVIDMAWKFFADLGLRNLSLNLNSIGCQNCRPSFVDALRDYYRQRKEQLCPECRRRLERNPLRLLDCKDPSCVALAENAPRSIDYLCPECASHFAAVKKHLGELNLPFVVNDHLVRGLDYYTRTVFEIMPAGETAAQAAIGAGGRYDRLIEELGGRPTPGIGFASGLERIILNLKKQSVEVAAIPGPLVSVVYMGEKAKSQAIALAANLRTHGMSAVLTFGERSLKAQLKQADSAGVNFAVIIGEKEVEEKTAVVRDMRNGRQETVSLEQVTAALVR